MEEKKIPPFEPFSNIAICLSGGGYRAAAFSLGTLSFLDSVQYNGTSLLQHVKAISTVSGGTITGVAYARSQAHGKTFLEFYRDLYAVLSAPKGLLDTALGFLNDEHHWNDSHKRPSLINAFALAYERRLTNGDRFDIFLGERVGHLQEVMFNATDFTYALPFRFQNAGKFGNGELAKGCPALGESKAKIKLSDIIAASSCFPVGFEPMIYPDDFLPPTEPEFAELKKSDAIKEGLGLMDGGIIDNQGVNSLMRAQDRRKDDKFQLIIICDVASPYLDKWTPSTETRDAAPWRSATYKTFDWNLVDFLLKGTSVPAWLGWFVSLGLLILSFTADLGKVVDLCLAISGSILFTITTGYLLAKKYAHGFVMKKLTEVGQSLVSKIPAFYRPLLTNFQNIRFGLFERMLRERGSSTVSLLNDIFLKQLRRLTFYQVYQADEWQLKRMMTAVYELTDYNFKSATAPADTSKKSFMQHAAAELLEPGAKIHDAALVAAKMPTTLWFEEEHVKANTLDHLIACGQFTMCYNLLIYLTELNYAEASPFAGTIVNDGKGTASPLGKLYDDLLTRWRSFMAEPLFMVSRPDDCQPA